ncbi:MAG: hypothetical protein ACR2P4_10005 [Gammaproteobacteria bacterium]
MSIRRCDEKGGISHNAALLDSCYRAKGGFVDSRLSRNVIGKPPLAVLVAPLVIPAYAGISFCLL